jgi:hypothetical protein
MAKKRKGGRRHGSRTKTPFALRAYACATIALSLHEKFGESVTSCVRASVGVMHRMSRDKDAWPDDHKWAETVRRYVSRLRRDRNLAVHVGPGMMLYAAAELAEGSAAATAAKAEIADMDKARKTGLALARSRGLI